MRFSYKQSPRVRVLLFLLGEPLSFLTQWSKELLLCKHVLMSYTLKEWMGAYHVAPSNFQLCFQLSSINFWLATSPSLFACEDDMGTTYDVEFYTFQARLLLPFSCGSPDHLSVCVGCYTYIWSCLRGIFPRAWKWFLQKKLVLPILWSTQSLQAHIHA